MPRKAAKSPQKPPRTRQPYTPEPVRGRVIARRMSGQSNRRIAREVGIDRGTVGQILSGPEALQMMERYQTQLLSLLPKAVRVLEEALDSDDPRVALGAATKLMEGLNVLFKRGIEHSRDLAKQASPELEHEDRELRILGEIVKHSLKISIIYGQPMPPGFEWLEPWLDERMKHKTGGAATAGGTADNSQEKSKVLATFDLPR